MMNSYKSLLALSLAMAITGCKTSDGDGDDTDTDTDTDAPSSCSAAISGTPFPANGADDVYYRTTFSLEFTQDESSTATFTLTKDSDSSEVTLGTLNWSDDGTAVYFSADGPLEPTTAYTLTVSYGAGCESPFETPISFTTSDVGASVASDDFVGTNYGLTLDGALIIEPPGVNSLLGSLLGQLEDTIMVVPESYNDTDAEISFFGGLVAVEGGNYVQDFCDPTIDFPEAASYDDPYFEIDAPDGITLNVAGVSVSLLALNLSGSFSPGGEDIVGITLAGSLDTRDIADLVGDLGGGTGDSAVCDLVSSFTGGAVSCEACPGGGGDFCLTLVATNITAEGTDFDLEMVTDSDIANDTDCDTDE